MKSGGSRSWPLAGRLAAIFAVSSLPLAAFFGYDLASRYAEQTHQARQHTAEITRGLAVQHEALIANARNLLSAIALVPGLRHASPADCRRILLKFLDAGSPFFNVTVAGADGVMRCSARFIDRPLDAAKLPYFQKVLATRRFAVGEVQVARVIGIPIMVFGYPVLDRDGNVESVLAAGVPLSFLGKALEDSRLPAGSAIAVTGADGGPIARIPPLRDGPRKPPRELVEALKSGAAEGSVDAIGTDGVPRLLAYTRVNYPGGEVYFSAGVTREAIYGPVVRRLEIYAVTLLAAVLLVALVAWRFGRNYLVAPLINVRDAAVRLGGGELGARADPRRPFREAAELADTFNDMAASIEDHMHRIGRLNRIYEVLSAINGALLRIRERDALIEEATRIAVQKGKFALVVIADVDDHGALDPVLSRSGITAEQLRTLSALLAAADSELARSVRQSLSLGEPAVLNDLRDPHAGALAALLQSLGLKSVALFPFFEQPGQRAVLCLGVPEPSFFDEDEVKLLCELTADTGLGLQYIHQATQLDFLRHHDPVTRLPNRESLEEHLSQVLARAQNRGNYVAVFTLDVNDYRRIVDAMGKHVGDAIVQRLASYLCSCVRDGDMVAVFGRDTFGVVLGDLRDESDGADVLDKVIGGLPSRIGAGTEEIFFTMRIGAALYPRDGGSAELLLGNAELAMQSVRGEAGTSFAFYSKAVDVDAHERLRIEAALRSAIANRELSVAYQPVVNIATREVVAAEALMRWTSATLGPVSPSRFIPIAEHRNLIVPMGEWLFETVAAFCAQWRSKGLPPIKCAVNVSMHQLADARFPERVRSILDAAGIKSDERALSVEITESQLMAAPDKMIDALERLRAIGLSLAIDDFGTGYSSLSYLTRLPVNTLKIDQSFVAAIGTRNGLAVVKAVVNLAHALGLWVVAEGVETERQLDLLQALHCDAAQGYLFSKPVSGEELERLIRSRAIGRAAAA